MKIRKILKKDSERTKEIVRNTILNSYCDFIEENQLKAYVASGRSHRLIDELFNDCYIAIEKNDILGLIIFCDNSIHMLLVNYLHQRKGVGEALMTFAEDILFQSYEVIKLDTIIENIKAMALYQKNGWLQYETEFNPEFNFNIAYFEKTR